MIISSMSRKEAECRVRNVVSRCNIVDAGTMFVSIPEMNQQHDPNFDIDLIDILLKKCSDQGLTFDAVLGIPDSGVALAYAMSLYLRKPFITTKKIPVNEERNKLPDNEILRGVVSQTWTDVVLTKGAPSFTSGSFNRFAFNMTHVTSNIKKLLVYDDVFARSYSGLVTLESLKLRGFDPTLVVCLQKRNEEGEKAVVDLIGRRVICAVKMNSISPATETTPAIVNLDRPYFS